MPWPAEKITILQLYFTNINLRNYYYKHPILEE